MPTLESRSRVVNESAAHPLHIDRSASDRSRKGPLERAQRGAVRSRSRAVEFGAAEVSERLRRAGSLTRRIRTEEVRGFVDDTICGAQRSR